MGSSLLDLWHRSQELSNWGEGQRNHSLLCRGVWELCNPALSDVYEKRCAAVLIKEQALMVSRYHMNCCRHNPTLSPAKNREIPPVLNRKLNIQWVSWGTLRFSPLWFSKASDMFLVSSTDRVLRNTWWLSNKMLRWFPSLYSPKG